MLAWVYYAASSVGSPTATGWGITDGSTGSAGTPGVHRWLLQRVREPGDTSISVTFTLSFSVAHLLVVSLGTADADTRGLASSADLYNTVTGEGFETLEFTEDPDTAEEWDPARGYLMFVEHTADSITVEEPPMEYLFSGTAPGGGWDLLGWYGRDGTSSMTITADGFVPTSDFLAFWTMLSFPLARGRWFLGKVGWSG
jgi:hypothetical protein